MRSGRPPKPADQKVTRHKPTHDWVRLPEGPARQRVPNLSKELGLAQGTHEWWKRIWKTPMAHMWADSDVDHLVELAVLRDLLVYKGKATVAGEVRQREDSFGLTIVGRRALRWLLPGEKSEEAPHVPDVPKDEVSSKRKERAKRLAAGDG